MVTVLETSFAPRPLAPSYIRRPALQRTITRGVERGQVMIIAPGGFGKTSLAADWYQNGAGPERCWVTLSDRQNTPTDLLTQLVHSIRTIRPDALPNTLNDLDGGARMADEDALAGVVNELCGLEPLTMILDDFNAISDRTTRDALAFILHNVPASVSTIICSRRDPLMPLTRWRSSGRMTEIRAADLQFSEDEARLLLDLLAAGDLTDHEIDAIVHASDGWPTGVYMAGVAAAHGEHASHMERGLAGGIRGIGEFFVDEVLDHMPEAWRSTLIETSILESITGPLAEAVTQRSDAADTLLALSEAGMFVARPPVDGGSFRVHAMLQPLLRSLLREHSSAEEIAQLHLRASEALSLAGHHLAAVEHAHVAQDAELVEDLLGAHGHEILARDPQGLARALRDMRRPEQPLSDLDLYAAVVRADREELEVQATRRPASDTQRAALRAVAQHLSGDVTLATSGPQELDGLPPGWGSLYRGMALTVSERYHEGGECLLQAAQADRGNSFLITASLAGLAWNNARAGKLGAARTFAAQALDRAGREQHPWFYATGWARLALAQVAYDQGRLEDAHRLASSVDSEDPLDDGARVESSILYSRVVWAMGDQSTARVILNSGFTGGGGTPITGVLALRLVLANVSLSLMERDADIATTWLPDWEQRLADGPLIPTERLTLAHLLIELDREDESRRLLADPEVDADRSHRSVLESWKLAALAAWKVGDPTAPLALEIAASMAQAEGFVQMFTESSELLAVVGRPTTSGVTIPVGSAPVAMAERRSADRAETLTTGQNVLVEELTEREFAVLRYVPTRLSNREIAEELFVSINTVKSHIKNIYRKLGVTTRRDAVARAVALRLM